MLLSHVAIGDIHYAEKVDNQCRRPPLRIGTARCCDSVVAKPGTMPGHQHNAEAPGVRDLRSIPGLPRIDSAV